MHKCKILTFIWKFLHDSLSVFAILNSRGIPANNRCLMCNEKEEIMTHVFLQCPFARAVWHGSILEIRTSDLIHSTVKQWISNRVNTSKSMEQNRMNFLQSLFTILWSIWNHRNLVFHRGKFPNPMEVILTSQSLICRYQEAFQEIKNRNITLDSILHNHSLTRIGRLSSKWQHIGTENPREVTMPLKP